MGNISSERSSIGSRFSLTTLFAAGIVVRLCFFPLDGFKQDFEFFSSWAAFTLEHSITEIYDHPAYFSHGLINYPPFYLYILALLAQAHGVLFGGGLDGTSFLCMIKSVTVWFEIVTTLTLYFFVQGSFGERPARLAAVGYFLNPAILYVGSYYGQVDAVFTAFLLISVVMLLSGKAFWSGCFAALALLTKIQTVPFLPLLFFILLSQKKWTPLAWQLGGFAVALFLVMTPFIFAGKAGLVYQRCIAENFAWSHQLSVSAFNPWFLHQDPKTWDYRVWGWLYGSDGMLQVNALTPYLTYKYLGLGLLGLSFLYCLYAVWSRCKKETVLLVFAWMALAFFMFPTKVHERYLYPFFVFYPLLCVYQPNRKWLLRGFTLTYLINLMVICPLIGEIKQPEEFDSTMGIWIAGINLILLAAFIHYELIQPQIQKRGKFIHHALIPVTVIAAMMLVWNRLETPPAVPDVLYLSSINPVSSPQQDWPPIPPEFGGVLPDPYYVLGKDHSIEKNELRIGDTLFRYGLGTHAESVVEYDVAGMYTHFETYIGIDHETLPMYEAHPNRATAVFEVWVNGERQYESGLKIPTSPAEFVRLRLPEKRAVNRIKLVVKNGDGVVFSDHADWALARVITSFTVN